MKRARIVIVLIFVAILLAIVFQLTKKENNTTSRQNASTDVSAPLADFSIQTTDELRTYTQSKPIPPIENNRFVRAATPDEHIRGNAEAPFSIIQFANFQNQYTVMMHPIIRSVVQNSNGDINWVFRQYPLPNRPLDYIAAQASECVAEEAGNARFWNYIDSIFAEAQVTEELLYSAAESLGAANVRDCVSSGSTRGYAVLDKQEGQLDGNVFITPSFFIRNNETAEVRFVEGANPPEYFEKIIAAMK